MKGLRMLYVNTSSQKFKTVRISVLHDIIKIWKKLNISKMTESYIFHNNNAEKLLTN